MPLSKTVLASLAVVSFAGLAIVPAGAQSYTTRQNAAGMCQGALPQFAGSLRARPLALANEGTSDAFITCSLVAENARRYQFINPLFFNRSGVATTATCTIVTGHVHSSPWYYTRTVSLPAGGGASIELTPNGADPSNMFNMNCRLPAGVELNYIRLDPQTT